MNSFKLSEEELQRFSEQGIDDDSFDLLDNETIQEIFPKAGPRLIFLKKYKEYLEKKAETTISFPSPVYTSSSDTLTVTSASGTIDSQGAGLIEIEIDESLADILKPASYSAESQEVNSYSQKRKNEFKDGVPSKRLMSQHIFEEGLENILANTVDGKIVLLRRNNLNNDCRQRLVKEVINSLVGKFGIEGVKSCMLESASEEIARIFPNESKSTYFIPYAGKTSNTSKQNAKGKLWSRFVNVRNAIRVANNAIQKEIKSPIKEYPSKESELDLLQTITEPKERVLALWAETYEQRRHVLRSSALTVEQLFDRYVALSTSIGPELIEYDFNVKYTDKADVIYSRLTVFSRAVLKEAESRKVTVISATNVDPNLKALLTLPYLFTPVTLRNKRKSGNWRPSRSEISDSFILCIEKFEDLEEKRSQRLEKLNKCNLTLQPFAVICGPLDNISNFFIVINDTIYKFDSLIRTIEILYKSFHSLDIEYPHECQHIWQLIEEAVYEMKHSPMSSSVSAVMSDLKKFM